MKTFCSKQKAESSRAKMYGVAPTLCAMAPGGSGEPALPEIQRVGRGRRTRRDYAISTTPRRSFGFTLIELLAVVLIIAILVSISIGIFQQARNAAWKQKARDTARQIALVWNARLIETTRFPNVSDLTPDPTYNIDANSLTFESNTNNMAHTSNLEQNADQRRNGMKDKWNRFFHIRLDTDYDGTISSPIDNTPIRANVLVWSLGPYPNDTSNSWIMVWPQ